MDDPTSYILNRTPVVPFHSLSMLHLSTMERSTCARLLIITYLAANFAVSLFKLIQTLCILALVVLCVWDQFFIGRWSHQKPKLLEAPERMELLSEFENSLAPPQESNQVSAKLMTSQSRSEEEVSTK